MRSGLTAALVLMALLVPARPAAAAQFPVGQEAYHTFDEVSAELAAVAAAHPRIVRVRTLGVSALGRPLWLVKISDRAGRDEPEPEVFVSGLVHAREHLTVEQALALVRWLTDDYGQDPRVTALVDSTEIWIAPMVNPDGGEHDIKFRRYRMWRKNRQPNPASTAIGTDLNRNFGYRWACCGGSSPWPWGDLYRGTRPFSAVEARAVRDFVRSRVVDGQQQLRLAVSLHSFGEKVLFPYGYTTDRLPPDMVPADRRAMRALARGMAARNGYTAAQESSWYVTDGTLLDWLYGARRIMNVTLELAPRTTAAGGFYLPADRISVETERNRDALLWFLEQAGCPYAAAGLTDLCDVSAGRPRTRADVRAPIERQDPRRTSNPSRDQVTPPLLTVLPV